MVQITLKRSSVPGSVPSGLAAGELAINVADRKIWTKDGTVGSKPDRFPSEVLLTGDPELTIPYYLNADGSSFDADVYPQLDNVFRSGADWGSAMKLADPLGDPSEAPGNDVAISGDGQYLAMGLVSAPFLALYKIEGKVVTRVAGPASLPEANVLKVRFGGPYLTVLSDGSLTIYKREGTTFTLLEDPLVLPSGTIGGAAISGDAQYLAVSGPGLTIYKRDGDTFTQLESFSLPGSGSDCSFSPDSTYLAARFTHGDNTLLIYKRDGDDFTELPVLTDPPTGGPGGVKFSPDGQYLVNETNSSPYIKAYRREDDVFTSLSVEGTIANSNVRVGISADSKYISAVATGTPYITIYKIEDETMTSVDEPDILPVAPASSADFSPDNQIMAVSCYGPPPFIILYGAPSSGFRTPNLPTGDPLTRYVIYTGQ